MGEGLSVLRVVRSQCAGRTWGPLAMAVQGAPVGRASSGWGAAAVPPPSAGAQAPAGRVPNSRAQAASSQDVDWSLKLGDRVCEKGDVSELHEG